MKATALPVKQWAAVAILLLALNVGSVIWYTTNERNGTAETAAGGNPFAAQMQSVSTYNY